MLEGLELSVETFHGSRTLVITTDNWDSYNHIHNTQDTDPAWRTLHPQKTDLSDWPRIDWVDKWQWQFGYDTCFVLTVCWTLQIIDWATLTNHCKLSWVTRAHSTLPLQETIFYEYLKYGMENKMGRWGELCVVVVWAEHNLVGILQIEYLEYKYWNIWGWLCCRGMFEIYKMTFWWTLLDWRW